MSRIGFYMCECGPNIKDGLHMESVLESAASMPGVVVSKPFGLLCSAQGKQFLLDEITSNELTHLVVGGCSPRQHESTFMDVCEQSGLNPYLFQMVNLQQ